jgi:hypothetical protein
VATSVLERTTNGKASLPKRKETLTIANPRRKNASSVMGNTSGIDVTKLFPRKWLSSRRRVCVVSVDARAMTSLRAVPRDVAEIAWKKTIPSPEITIPRFASRSTEYRERRRTTPNVGEKSTRKARTTHELAMPLRNEGRRGGTDIGLALL